MQAQDAMQGLLHQKAHLAYIASHLPSRLPSTGMPSARAAPSKGQPAALQSAGDENVSSNVESGGQQHGSKPRKAVPRRYSIQTFGNPGSCLAQHLVQEANCHAKVAQQNLASKKKLVREVPAQLVWTPSNADNTQNVKQDNRQSRQA